MKKILGVFVGFIFAIIFPPILFYICGVLIPQLDVLYNTLRIVRKIVLMASILFCIVLYYKFHSRTDILKYNFVFGYILGSVVLLKIWSIIEFFLLPWGSGSYIM